MSKSEKRTYTKEFRAEAVKMVLEQGMSLEEAGASLALPKGTLANWVAAARRGDGLVSFRKLQPALQPRAQRDEVQRLGQVLVHAGFHAGGHVGVQRVGGQGEDGEVRQLAVALLGTDAAGAFQAVHARHLDVHQHEVGRGLLAGDEGFDAVLGEAGGARQSAVPPADHHHP